MREITRTEINTMCFGKSIIILFVAVILLLSVFSCNDVSQKESNPISTDLGATQEELNRISTDLGATQEELNDIKAQLAEAESKITEYEIRLREYTKIVDSDYPNLQKRVQQASLILEIINTSVAYERGLVGEMELFNAVSTIDLIDSREIKEDFIKMIQSGKLMSEVETDIMMSSWLAEVESLLQY